MVILIVTYLLQALKVYNYILHGIIIGYTWAKVGDPHTEVQLRLKPRSLYGRGSDSVPFADMNSLFVVSVSAEHDGRAECTCTTGAVAAGTRDSVQGKVALQ